MALHEELTTPSQGRVRETARGACIEIYGETLSGCFAGAAEWLTENSETLGPRAQVEYIEVDPKGDLEQEKDANLPNKPCILTLFLERAE